MGKTALTTATKVRIYGLVNALMYAGFFGPVTENKKRIMEKQAEAINAQQMYVEYCSYLDKCRYYKLVPLGDVQFGELFGNDPQFASSMLFVWGKYLVTAQQAVGLEVYAQTYHGLPNVGEPGVFQFRTETEFADKKSANANEDFQKSIARKMVAVVPESGPKITLDNPAHNHLFQRTVAASEHNANVNEQTKLDAYRKYVDANHPAPVMSYEHFCKTQTIEQKEMVNHPQHYGGDTVYEVIKVIAAWELDFPCGSAVKYIARAGKKNPDEEIQDLEKAKWYLQWKIDDLKKQQDAKA